METQLAIYRKMDALSKKMAEAARAREWERLIALENMLSGFRDVLMSGNATLVEDDAAQISELIRGILENDAEVRKHVEPWLEHIQHFLGNEAIKRRIAETYGVQ
jgi:flagellar protein FliT